MPRTRRRRQRHRRRHGPDRGLPQSGRRSTMDGAISRTTQAAGAIVRGMTIERGNEIDEFVVDALRNNLLGLPLDLAAINIARGRDTGMPTLNEARAAALRRERLDLPEALRQLGRLRGQPEEPGLGRQLHRRLRHARDDHSTRHTGREARGRDAAGDGRCRRRWRRHDRAAPADRIALPERHRRLGRPRPASTLSTSGSAAWPRRRCRSAACSARPSTPSSKRSSKTCRTATASTT